MLLPPTAQVPLFLPRLLAQLNETEAAFDEFWAKHQQKLEQCLQLRHFEQDFREVSGPKHAETCRWAPGVLGAGSQYVVGSPQC